jgi:hypothetical protein
MSEPGRISAPSANQILASGPGELLGSSREYFALPLQARARSSAHHQNAFKL